MASYLLLVLHDYNVYHYGGSETDWTPGFLRRRAQCKKLTYTPKFITKLIEANAEFTVLMVLPILRIDPQNSDDFVFGEMRVPIFIIETLIMTWLRCFRKRSAYEKLMAYSPWAADDVSFVRSTVHHQLYSNGPKVRTTRHSH